jgi:hypothetical protein
MSEVKAKYVQCGKIGCAFELPWGYTSPRGYCADCEYEISHKLMGESLDSRAALERIKKIAEGSLP